MTQTNRLQDRIDAEFTAIQAQIKNRQEQTVIEYEGRQERLKLFEQRCQQLQEIWRPRLEVLTEKFSGRVKVTPQLKKGLREVVFVFQSELASVRLRFSASTDTDVRKLVLDYNLEILPILMKFDSHQQIDFPLESIDDAAVGEWIDNRIVDFVQTYLAMSQNEYYLKDHMVVDPVAGVKFPKFAAVSQLERRGKTHYFISEETRHEFERQQAAAVEGARVKV